MSDVNDRMVEERLAGAARAGLPDGARDRLERALHAAEKPEAKLWRRRVPLGYAAAAGVAMLVVGVVGARVWPRDVRSGGGGDGRGTTVSSPERVMLASSRVDVGPVSRPVLTHEPPRIERWVASVKGDQR